MKAFIVKSIDDQEEKDPAKAKFTSYKFNENQEFNYITIANPLDSKVILIIENVGFKIYSYDNEVSILIGEKKVSSMRKSRLNFNCELYSEIDRNLELKLVKVNADEQRQLLHKEALILLPEGCIFVRLKNAVKFIEVNISFREEVI